MCTVYTSWAVKQLEQMKWLVLNSFKLIFTTWDTLIKKLYFNYVICSHLTELDFQCTSASGFLINRSILSYHEQFRQTLSGSQPISLASSFPISPRKMGSFSTRPWYLQVGIAEKDGDCRTQPRGLNPAHFLQGSLSFVISSALKPFKATNKLWESYITINKDTVAKLLCNPVSLLTHWRCNYLPNMAIALQVASGKVKM